MTEEGDRYTSWGDCPLIGSATYVRVQLDKIRTISDIGMGPQGRRDGRDLHVGVSPNARLRWIRPLP